MSYTVGNAYSVDVVESDLPVHHQNHLHPPIFVFAYLQMLLDRACFVPLLFVYMNKSILEPMMGHFEAILLLKKIKNLQGIDFSS